MPCARCVKGQYVEDDDRRVCLQCGHDPLQEWFGAHPLPYIEESGGVTLPVGGTKPTRFLRRVHA